MIYVYSAAWVGLEALCYFFLFSSFLRRKKSIAPTIVAYLVTWLLIMLSTVLGITSGIGQFIPVLIAAGISFAIYSGKWYIRFLSALLCYALFAIEDAAVGYGMCFIRGISFSALIWQKNAYLTAVTSAKLLELLTAWLLFRSRKNREAADLSMGWFLLIVIFPVTSVVLLVILFYSFQGNSDLSGGAIVASVVVGIANAAILYTIQAIEKNAHKEREMEILKRQIAYQANHFQSIENSYRAQRKSVHEFEHHLQVLENLLDAKENDALSDYVKHLQENRALKGYSIHSHHPVIDAILNPKYQLAQEQGINMHIQVNDLSGVHIQTEYVVVLLSNLLDNAMEACLALETDRQIICKVIADGALYVSVRNTSKPVEISDGEIRTTKESRIEHGFGIPAIKFILDQLGAEYTFAYEDGWFEFASEIPMEELIV